MVHVSRPVKVSAALLALIIGGYSLARLGMGSGSVSTQFTDARMQGALIAQDIVNLSNEMGTGLEQVHALDASHNFTEALNVTQGLVEKSREVRKKAVELSAQLEQQTTALESIASDDARAAALESITDRLALITRLINYSDSLADLLDALQARFTGAAAWQNSQVTELIQKINSEVTAINHFNRQASQAMDRFDAIIAGKK